VFISVVSGLTKSQTPDRLIEYRPFRPTFVLALCDDWNDGNGKLSAASQAGSKEDLEA